VTAAHQYQLIICPTARRQLAKTLPEAVAFAAHEFIAGPLLDNPQRVGLCLVPRSRIATALDGAPTESSIAST
jgi:hypothetical protein